VRNSLFDIEPCTARINDRSHIYDYRGLGRNYVYKKERTSATTGKIEKTLFFFRSGLTDAADDFIGQLAQGWKAFREAIYMWWSAARKLAYMVVRVMGLYSCSRLWG
jgi:hypothetical protein